MTNRTIKGKHEAVDGIEKDSPKKIKGILTPGMEDALSGHTLGQYQLMARLGRGGMATVYKAYQPSLDRNVAVKVLSTFLAQDPDFAARFQREARAIAKLNHPNILPVYDYGHEGELVYIVMRYVEGGTLQDMLGQPLDLDMAVEIIAQMGGALDYAHRQGIVHRDIKPRNVLMADGNWALLSDFGLARMIGASTQITQTGVGMGTPAYIAPEQARGWGVDARSDIYALGTVLFEMLTGRVPFKGDSSLIVLFKLVNDPVPLPRGFNPDIPEPVEQVLLKALAKDPVDRFQRAGQMVAALQKAVSGGPEVTAAVSLADERKQEEAKSDGLYAQALSLLQAEEWQKALEKWAKVQAIDPAYPDSQEVVIRAKRGLAKLEASVTPVEQAPSVKEEAVPLWRRVPVWAWAAMGGAILLATAIAGATLSPKADPESPAVVAPTSTSTPVPATPTLTPTTDVAATETAWAALAADVVAGYLAQTATAEAAFSPTPTDTLTPTETPVPPTTATATHTLTPPTPTLVPAATEEVTSSITLTIYLRDTNTEMGSAALNGDQPNGGMIYEEGGFVYGEAAVQIGDTIYHFDEPEVEPGEPEQLPDPWRVEFEFAEELVAHTGNQAGFGAKKAQFWVGTLDSESAVGEDNPYHLTIKLYEGDEFRESLQVFFTVADAPDGGGGGGEGCPDGKCPYIEP